MVHESPQYSMVHASAKSDCIAGLFRREYSPSKAFGEGHRRLLFLIRFHGMQHTIGLTKQKDWSFDPYFTGVFVWYDANEAATVCCNRESDLLFQEQIVERCILPELDMERACPHISLSHKDGSPFEFCHR